MGGWSSPSTAILLVLSFGLTAAACGSPSEVSVDDPALTSTVAGAGTTGVASGAPPAPATPASSAPDRSATVLPSVALTDVRSGGTVDLASLVPAQQPLLLWFWAPH